MTRKWCLFATFVRLLVFVVFVYPFPMGEQGGAPRGVDLTAFATTPGATGATAATHALEGGYDDLYQRCEVSFMDGCSM